jgi:hypothetical protein
MKQVIYSIVSVMALLALPVSGSMVRGTISDSATGAPISNVRVIFAKSIGEMTLVLDSAITGTTGSFAFPGQSGTGLYLYTIADGYYFQSISILGGFIPVGIDDTITQNIKLKSVPTMVAGAPDAKALHGITVRTSKSRLYLSGIEAGAVVDLYDLNGRRLFRTVMTAGASEVSMPEWIAAAGSYYMSINANGRLTRGTVLSRGLLW